MPKVTYISNDGSSQMFEGSDGQSLMSIAVDAGIDGIVGRCGGFSNCGTCHVYVDEAWLDQLPELSPEENMMLDGTPAERKPVSRLSCQIPLVPALNGLVVTIPEMQE